MGDYEKLLDAVTKNVQERITLIGDTKVKGTDFEKIVYEELLKAGVSEDAITHSTQKFPDFIIDDETAKIGVEVKKTDADKWDVPGGSVYESLRNSIETFVLMGKFGGVPEARFRKYEECISDLTVTHSPRFHLKMDIAFGEDYLTRNNASDLLDLPKGKELNRRIRELLRTDKDTWYTEDSVEAFTDLAPEEKRNFFVDGVVLFPEVTGGNYSNFAPWMTYKCLVWCSNIRDVFSAGGTKEFDGIIVSAVMARMMERTDLIATTNNRMEMRAVMLGLDQVEPGSEIHLYSDSQYTLNCLSGVWGRKKNADLWRKMDRIISGYSVETTWVRGHNGNEYNEMCDSMCTEAMQHPTLTDQGYLADAPASDKARKRKQKQAQDAALPASLKHAPETLPKDQFATKHQINAKCAAGILHFRNSKKKFKDYASLKTFGQDFWSRKKIDFMLQDDLNKDDLLQYLGQVFGEESPDIIKAVRWYKRGLSADDAAHKVKVDKEIAENAMQ